MKLFGRKDKKGERDKKGEKEFVECVDIEPGESREFVIPFGLLEEMKRLGKTKGIISIKYNDESGNEYEQKYELNVETGEIKEL